MFLGEKGRRRVVALKYCCVFGDGGQDDGIRGRKVVPDSDGNNRGSDETPTSQINPSRVGSWIRRHFLFCSV
jgi:hypothetical protein